MSKSVESKLPANEHHRGMGRKGQKDMADTEMLVGMNGTSRSNFIATYSKSDVAHQQSLVFEAAARGSVLLRERAGRNFVLVSEDNYRIHLRAATEAAALLPMLDVAPEQMPELLGYAWTASLSVEDRASFQRDCRLQLRRALEDGDWAIYDRTRDKWRDTARVMADPELHARLMEDWDEEGEIEILRP